MQNALSFNPTLNTKSREMTTGNKNIIERTQDVAYKRRSDRDPFKREFEEQQKECTFKP